MEITYTKKVITYPGMVAKISQPVLSDKEKARRMKQIENAVAALMRG